MYMCGVCTCVCACREVNVNHRNETIIKLSGENDFMDIVSDPCKSKRRV